VDFVARVKRRAWVRWWGAGERMRAEDEWAGMGLARMRRIGRRGCMVGWVFGVRHKGWAPARPPSDRDSDRDRLTLERLREAYTEGKSSRYYIVSLEALLVSRL